jgi:hypothetical protein
MNKIYDVQCDQDCALTEDDELLPLQIEFNFQRTHTYHFSWNAFKQNLSMLLHLLRLGKQRTRNEADGKKNLREIAYKPYLCNAKIIKAVHVDVKKTKKDDGLHRITCPSYLVNSSKILMFFTILYPFLWLFNSIGLNMAEKYYYHLTYAPVLWYVYITTFLAVFFDHMIDSAIIIVLRRPLYMDGMVGDFLCISAVLLVLAIPLMYKNTNFPDDDANRFFATKALNVNDFICLVSLCSANIVMNRLLETVIRAAITDKTVYLDDIHNIVKEKKSLHPLRTAVLKTLYNLGIHKNKPKTESLENNPLQQQTWFCCFFKRPIIPKDSDVERGMSSEKTVSSGSKSEKKVLNFAEVVELHHYSQTSTESPTLPSRKNSLEANKRPTRQSGSFSSVPLTKTLIKFAKAQSGELSEEISQLQDFDASDEHAVTSFLSHQAAVAENKIDEGKGAVFHEISSFVPDSITDNLDALEPTMNEMEMVFQNSNLLQFRGKTGRFRALMTMKLIFNVATAGFFLLFSSIYFRGALGSMVWVLFLSFLTCLTNITTAVCIKTHDDTVSKIYHNDKKEGVPLHLEIGTFAGFNHATFYWSVMLSIGNLIYHVVSTKF